LEIVRNLHGFGHVKEVLTSFRNMSSLDVLFSSSSFLPWTCNCCSASVQADVSETHYYQDVSKRMQHGDFLACIAHQLKLQALPDAERPPDGSPAK
jgi:hypothetical protein